MRTPEYISTLETSTPIADHVLVDFELRGCPINKQQLVELIAVAAAAAASPTCRAQRLHRVQAAAARSASRWRRGSPAWGRSRRPAAARSARPATATATAASARWSSPTWSASAGCYGDAAATAGHLVRLIRNFNGYAPEFREASDALEQQAASEPSDEPTRMTDEEPTMPANRTFEVKALARVEGEGALYVKLDGDQVEHVELNIYEPPRFFEAFLRGREFREVPDITARICGICPVAYQMSSCHALEKALGDRPVAPGDPHACAACCTAASGSRATPCTSTCCTPPTSSATRAASAWPPTTGTSVEKGLRLKKIGNELLEVLGGRAIHPINVAVGGFYRAPERAPPCRRCCPTCEWGLQAVDRDPATGRRPSTSPTSRSTTRWSASGIPHEYPMNEGRVVSSRRSGRAGRGVREATSRNGTCTQSTALHSVTLPGETSYLVGPLARVNLCFDQLSPTAKRAGGGLRRRMALPQQLQEHHRPGDRADRRLRGGDRDRQGLPCRAGAQPACLTCRAPAQGCHATEAPRGLLYHRYRIGDDGLIAEAKIVPPTSQNLGQIEDDLRAYLPGIVDLDDAEATRRCEHLIRNYDPCISCATHFLRLTIDRNPEPAVCTINPMQRG